MGRYVNMVSDHPIRAHARGYYLFLAFCNEILGEVKRVKIKNLILG